jgi:hypothetical protein
MKISIFWNVMPCKLRDIWEHFGGCTSVNIAQSVEQLATGWTAKVQESQKRQDFSPVHPAYYPKDTRGSFPGGKAARTLSCPLASN